MDYPIFYRGEALGSLLVEPDGLYYRLSARCREPEERGIWRLWACLEADSRCVGVLAPETGGLRLERRVSRRSWSVMPDCFVLGREREGFLPWRGTLEQEEIPDAMLRAEADGSRTLAIFAPPEGPVPLGEYLSLMREGVLDGRACLLLERCEELPPAAELCPTPPEEPAP